MEELSSKNEEALTKIWVDLPNHWMMGGESFWAKPLGDNEYEIRNSPFGAYGLNFNDVVIATAEDADKKSEIRSLVRRSGHSTLRFYFPKDISEDVQTDFLGKLNSLGASYEGMKEWHFAVDIPPEVNYNPIIALLEESEKCGLLFYETCEARVEGSFDDVPDEDAEIE